MRLIILITVVLSLLGCGSEKAADDKSKTEGKPATKPVLVELAAVERGMIEEILERSSALEAEAQVQVLARTQNPAVELFVEEGDKVAKGQVLLRLENDRQQTDYDQAKSQLEEALIEFDRQESLYTQNLISESDYRNAKFTFNRAELTLETAKRQLEYTEVRAPIKGTVTSRTVNVGDQVGSGVPIFQIIDLESTVAIIHVPEQYLPKLKSNMEARLISNTFEGQFFSGFVKRISPIVEATAGLIKVVVGVKDLGPLRPGMWVDVELVLDSKEDALLIPKRSITYDNDQIFAFKVYTDTNGVRRAKRHLVKKRNEDKLHIEPLEGFEVGEEIIVAGQSGLKDDSTIRVLGDSDATSLTPTPPIVKKKTKSNSTAAKKTTAQGGS